MDKEFRPDVPTVNLTASNHALLKELVLWYDSRPKGLTYNDSFHEWFDQRIAHLLDEYRHFNGWVYQTISVSSAGDIVMTVGWEEDINGQWTMDPAVITVGIV